MKRFLYAYLSTLGFAAIAGCGFGGPGMYHVSGEVHFQGEPVQRGTISFIPDDATQRTAATRIEDGKYSLEMTAGARKVEIMATRDNGPIDPVMGQAPQLQYIPDKFNVVSELRAEITADSDNQFDFNLTP